MFAALLTLLAKWFQSPPKEIEIDAYEQKPSTLEFLRGHYEGDDLLSCGEIRSVTAHPVPYDKNLLERAHTQWQFGDWQGLSQINCDALQHHPDRAKLALLAAAGRVQTGHNAEAKQFIRIAQDWGVSKKLIGKILIGGVYNSIGRAAAIGNQQNCALKHFENSITIGTQGVDAKLLSQARAGAQLNQIRSLTNTRSNFFENEAVRRNYFVKLGYISRTKYFHHHDMEEEDNWQREVYLRANGMMKKNGWSRVVDIGCGSAYKLINYLGDFDTTGIELPINVEELKKRYPDRLWRSTSFGATKEIDTDLIVCSDVIEHLVDPDILMQYLQLQNFKALVLSTPERDICRGASDMGPPENPAHQREWNFEEFEQYVSEYFQIEDHAVVNLSQGTQLAICKKYYPISG
jgi:hypothetical protein